MAERTNSVERRGEDGRPDVPSPSAGDIGRRSKTVIEKIKLDNYKQKHVAAWWIKRFPLGPN